MRVFKELKNQLSIKGYEECTFSFWGYAISSTDVVSLLLAISGK
jgi:hypothetical protein